MNAFHSLLESRSASAFTPTLDRTAIQERTPAALALAADPRTSPSYAFVSSERIIQALGDAGFYPVNGTQVRGRGHQRLSARHAIRFRRRYETVNLRDAIPEILFINGHDGRTSTLMLGWICHH